MFSRTAEDSRERACKNKWRERVASGGSVVKSRARQIRIRRQRLHEG